METLEKTIYIEAAKILFRNSDNPNNIVRLAKLKLPRIIEIISNAPKHIIDQMIENYKKKNQKMK